jgi:hypothetical protein
MASPSEASEILKAIGLPPQQHNERSALTLLVLAGLGPNDDWSKASQALLRTVDIMGAMRDRFEKDYQPNTRETIRRQTLHQFRDARVVDQNPDDPRRPTNSGLTCYALTDAVLPVLRSYGTAQFSAAVKKFVNDQGSLQELYRRQRELQQVPVTFPNGEVVQLSPGKHNDLQKMIIEEFAPRFAPGATLLYIGDTANKTLFLAEEELAKLGINITNHDKLPDVVLVDYERGWIYFIEAVTSHGPVSNTRKTAIESMLNGSDLQPIFVSAFLNRGDFRQWVADIAWETEVWLGDEPDHLIHFNGDKFLGPFEPGDSASR